MPVVKIPPGETGRLTRERINEIIDQANKSDNIFAGPGSNVRGTAKSIEISDTILSFLSREPAIEVDVVNTGTEALRAFGLAGINQNFDRPSTEDDEDAGDFGDLLNRRVLEVRTPIADDVGCFVILQNGLDVDEVGKAWIGGTTLCILQRWFDSQLLNYADIEDGETHALAKVQGGLQILWEQKDNTDDLPIDEDHFAVVRFTNNFRPMPVVNNGDTDMEFGGPLIPTNVSGISDGRYSVGRPDEDSAPSVLVAQAAIEVDAVGRAIFAGAPFLANIDETGDVGDNYGTEEDESDFRHGAGGFKLLADLGIHDSKSWGVLHSVAPFLVIVPDAQYVAEDQPDTNFLGSAPQAQVKEAAGNERWGIWKFPGPIKRLEMITLPAAGFSVTGDDATAQVFMDLWMIEADFDLSTVTWNTKPAAATKFTASAGDFSIRALGPETTGATSGAFTYRIGKDRGGLGPLVAGAGKQFFGFYFRPKDTSPLIGDATEGLWTFPSPFGTAAAQIHRELTP